MGALCSISGFYTGQGKSKTNFRLTAACFVNTQAQTNYTSRDNCSIYSLMLGCCFLPAESHSRGRRTHMYVFPYGDFGCVNYGLLISIKMNWNRNSWN